MSVTDALAIIAILAILVACGLALYTMVLRRDLSAERRRTRNLRADEKMLIAKHNEIIDSNTSTIRGQERQLKQRGERIRILESRCANRDRQVSELQQQAAEDDRKIKDLRSELAASRRALAVQVGRSAGMSAAELAALARGRS